MTTCLDCCFHHKFIPEPSYFHHISSGGPAVPHHFQCGGGQCQAEGHDSLPPLLRVRDIMVLNEKGVDGSEVTTGRGQGWQQTTRRPPGTRIPVLTS